MPSNDIIVALNSRNRTTLAKIHRNPVPVSIKWADIESVLSALGADVTRGGPSRVRVELNGVRAVFQKPDPKPTTDRCAVKSVREFLAEAGVSPP